MKLKKVLSALTAAALAAMTLAITPITASATISTLDPAPDGTETVLDSMMVDDTTAISNIQLSTWGSQWMQNYNSDLSTWIADSDVYLKITLTDVSQFEGDNGDLTDMEDVFMSWDFSWLSFAIIDSTNYFPTDSFTSDLAYVYVPLSNFSLNSWNGIGFNIQAGHVGMTISSAEIVEFSTATLVTDITVTLDDSDLVVGETTTANASVLPADATDNTVAWSSSNPGVAAVDDDGVVTAVASGTADIIATANDGSEVTGSATVTVTNPATAVAVGSTSVTILEGSSQEVAVTVTPADADDVSYTFESSDESVAAVEGSVDGVTITGVAVGPATITIALTSDSSITATINVTVTDTEVAATAIEVTPTELSLEVGGTSTLSAALTPSDTTDSATYTSSDESVATVSSTGIVTAVGEGTATITVKANDDVYTTVAVTVTVPENPVTAITVSSDSVSVFVGETATVTATITPSDADDTTVTWASSDETVAAVANGVITGVAAGTATVTASSANGLTATVAVTVTEETTTTTDTDDTTTTDTDDTTTTTTHTHVYDSGVKKGMYYVYTCAICGDTYEVYYANDSQWAATFWGLVGQYGTTSTRTASASTSSEEVIEDTEVEETAAEATSSDSAYTKTMTIDATGSYWDQVALTLEELLGDIDPATVKSITISGSDTFCIGYNNADGWVQTDDDTEFELSDISFEDDVYYVAFVGRVESGTTTITWTINT